MGDETIIYGLADPRDGTIHYVGYTTDPAQRLTGHCASALKEKRSRVEEWIRCLRADGTRPEMIVLEQLCGQETDEAEEAERFWIASLNGRHPLKNVRKGGWTRPEESGYKPLYVRMPVADHQRCMDLAAKLGVPVSVWMRALAARELDRNVGM